MLRTLKGILLAACFTAVSNSAGVAVSRADEAETEDDFDICAGSDFDKADEQLNQVYTSILTRYADDPEFVEKLKLAQRAWSKFRAAELDALFPHREQPAYYGSVYPLCRDIWMTTLTNERIGQLKRWQNRVEEGDVCSGSIKIR